MFSLTPVKLLNKYLISLLLFAVENIFFMESSRSLQIFFLQIENLLFLDKDISFSSRLKKK